MTSSTAKRIRKTLEKKGAPVVFEKKGEPVLDPTTRIQTVPTYKYPAHVIVDSTSLVSLGEIFGPDLVQSGDLNMSMHNLYSFEPQQGDVVILDGERYNVITRRPIYYKKGEVVMWRFLARYGMRNDSRSKGE